VVGGSWSARRILEKGINLQRTKDISAMFSEYIQAALSRAEYEPI